MTDDYREQIDDLLVQADQLQEGPAQIMLLEEAVRLADTHGDLDLGFSLREELIEACTFGGFPDKSLVAFTWCLGQCDRDPDRFFDDDLLWKYKWVINSLQNFPQISLAQIKQSLADMEQRYHKVGAGKRAICRLHADLALHRGDREEAARWTAQWEKTPRDHLSDCPACEQNSHVRFFVFCGRDEEAVLAAGPILSGRLKCKEIPHFTLGKVLLPLLRLGRLDEAMEYHKKGYRLVGRNRLFLTTQGQHLAFAALTDNLGRAAKILERHLSDALDTVQLERRFDFYLYVLVFLDRLLAKGKHSVPLRLPKTFPAFQENGRYQVADLTKWFGNEAHQLGRQFDLRNGTDWFATKLADNRQLQGFASPYPYKKDGGEA